VAALSKNFGIVIFENRWGNPAVFVFSLGEGPHPACGQLLPRFAQEKAL
jgi:hypothetical protein